MTRFDQIDYFKTPPTLEIWLGLALFGAITLAPIVWFWTLTPLQPVLVILTATGVLIITYAFITELATRANADKSLLSLTADGLVVDPSGAQQMIPYDAVKLIDVGSRRIDVWYLENGCEAQITLDIHGMPAFSGEAIKEEIARRIPAENIPRTGPNILICSPGNTSFASKPLSNDVLPNSSH